MIYRIYTQFMEHDRSGQISLLIGAVADDGVPTDSLLDCLKIDKNFAARVQTLYVSIINARPLPLEIVRPLSKEQNLSIKELKKAKIRLAFFVDVEFYLSDSVPKKAIVFLLRFPKKDKKTTENAIKKAQAIRDEFLELKLQKKINTEVIDNA